MEPLYELALFAGGGGGILGGMLLGWRTVGAVEIEPSARGILLRRQADGSLPFFPIWDDVRTFRSDNPACAEFFNFLRSIADRLVISGGFPCQDISSAGTGQGLSGERSGLWFEYARIIREIRPRYVFVENSSLLISRGIGIVLCGLAEMGYPAKWGVFRSSDFGAPHERERLFIAADANQKQRQARMRDFWQFRQPSDVPWFSVTSAKNHEDRWLEMACAFSRMDDGMAGWVDRVKAIGNGQSSVVAATAFRVLSNFD